MKSMKICDGCEKEIPKKQVNYLNGRPYCHNCYEEAEANYQGFDDDEYDDDDEDEDDEFDEDEDEDEDD